MKAYRLYNLTELGPASPFYFIDRKGAEDYQDYVRWPYRNTGRYPLHGGGSVPVAQLSLRTEETDLNALLLRDEDLVLMEKNGKIGSCHLLPGDCFNPDDWEATDPAALGHPEALALLEEHARRKDNRWHV